MNKEEILAKLTFLQRKTANPKNSLFCREIIALIKKQDRQWVELKSHLVKKWWITKKEISDKIRQIEND